MVSSEQLCRLCAGTGQCVRVFDSEGEKYLLKHKLRVCVPVIVREDDVLPKQICVACVGTVDSIYEFYQKTKSVQRQLPTLMKLGSRKRSHSAEVNEDAHCKRLCTSQKPLSAPGLSAIPCNTLPAAVKEPPLFVRVETTLKCKKQKSLERIPSEQLSDISSGDEEVLTAPASPVAHKDVLSPASLDSQFPSKERPKNNLKIKPEPSSPIRHPALKKSQPSLSSFPDPDLSSEKFISCPKCKREVPAQALHQHMSEWHKQEQDLPIEVRFSCDLCAKSFFVEAAYERHRQRHQTNSDTVSKKP